MIPNSLHDTRYWDSICTAIGIFTLVAVSGVATYLQHYQPMHLCAFCALIRYLFMIIGWLYLFRLLSRPPGQWLYITQLCTSIIGFILSLRQVSFQHSLSALTTCKTPKVHLFKAVLHWLTSGAPGCQVTPTFGPLTLASWSCIGFGILIGLIGFQLYLKRND